MGLIVTKVGERTGGRGRRLVMVRGMRHRGAQDIGLDVDPRVSRVIVVGSDARHRL
jgi:hypothetical protein